MSDHGYEIGLQKRDLDTPCLLVDMDVVQKNITVMADFCKEHGIGLRPHAKIYKATPFFAWMQLRAGAIGITVSKLSEAEVLAAAGIRDILIANQVVGTQKVKRLVNLAAYTDIIVAVDSVDNARMISDMASLRGVEAGVLVEIDIGNNRCGVMPFEPSTMELVKTVLRLKGLKFRGIMGYDGHLALLEDKAEKERQSVEAYKTLVAVKEDLISKGIGVEIVSGGGSATYKHAASVKGLTELQAGSYIFNDSFYQENGLDEFACALTLLGTVVSRPDRQGAEDMAVLDVGRKSCSLTYGFPCMKEPAGEIYSMPQEHSRLKILDTASGLKAGDKVEIWVRDANETINLYDCIYAMRGDIVEAVLDITGRGRAK